jgi:hypothetical protein
MKEELTPHTPDKSSLNFKRLLLQSWTVSSLDNRVWKAYVYKLWATSNSALWTYIRMVGTSKFICRHDLPSHVKHSRLSYSTTELPRQLSWLSWNHP